MGCGCKNRQNGAGGGNITVKATPVQTQESKPEKTANGNRIIKREIK